MNQPDHISLWHKCLEIIRDNMNADLFDTWFKPAEPLGYADGVVTIGVPSEFWCQQYEGRFFPMLLSAMRKVYGNGVKLEYRYKVVSGDPESEVTVASSSPSPTLNNAVDRQTRTSANPFINGVEYEDIDPQLNATYNFENYCVGDSNKLPYTIAEYIGNNPGKTDFNPFFLYGATGVGKTHLIQAIGIRVRERFPKARVLYLTSRIFENQYGKAVRDKQINDFINFYQSIDVLLLDDIQELSGKPGMQNAFFPIFSYLHQRGRLLIMTSDRAPVDLDGMMDRLVNRFKWGVTEQLCAPDLNLRKEILRCKARKNGLALGEDVIDVIATHVTESIRELEGVVLSLLTRATILNQPITVELAKMVMQSAVKLNKKKINFDMIVEATASAYNIDPDAIFSKNRVRDIADARQVIMYLANKHTDLSSTSIGCKLARSHATVLHGISVVKQRMSVESALADSIDEIERSLR